MTMPPATPEGAYDAVVVGGGPNGLAAAIELARNGKSVALFEAADTVGGGCRSAPLTRRHYTHDVCSSVHALALASPFMRSLDLESYGVNMVHPAAPLAHALDGSSAVTLERRLHTTGLGLGMDGDAYERLFGPLLQNWEVLIDDVLAPLRWPRRPGAFARFGLGALRPAASLARSKFTTSRARSLFAGIAAHSMLSLSQPPTGGVALMLGLLAHAVGWPIVRGGSGVLSEALGRHLTDLGGRVFTGCEIKSMGDLPAARAYMFDLTPRQLASIAADRLPSGYLRRLEKYRYGPGVFKLDLALDGPVPWNAGECARAATVHLGGSLEEIAASEEAVVSGRHAERPFVILVQASHFDTTRAPKGKHTVWAYCHVPAGSSLDVGARIEDQIERFAHRFKDRIVARHKTNAVQMEAYNANYVGGDINGGVQDLRQLFTRPVARVNPYTTPDRAIYICSSSTPPGGGVHGMCGYHAARTALKRAFGRA